MSNKCHHFHKILRNKFAQTNIPLAWAALLLTLFLLAANLTGCGKKPEAMIDGEPFEPTQDTTIEGGNYHIPSMNIPKDVHLNLEGDINLIVDGDVQLAGDMQGQCTDITMKVDGAFILTGNLDNTGCLEEESAHLTLNLAGDQTIQLGEEDSKIEADGDLIINIGDVEGLESTPSLPFEPAQDSTPPVCYLSTDALVTDLTEESLAYIPLWGECLDPDGGTLQTITLEHKLMNSDDWIYEPDHSGELFNEGEAILTVGRAIKFIEEGVSLVVNCAPFGCMPGTITSSLFQELQNQTGVPIVNMFYDGEGDLNNLLRVYLEQV